MKNRLPALFASGGLAAIIVAGMSMTAQANIEATDPSIIVRNQGLENNQLTLDYAFLPQKGYAVVYKAGEDGKPSGEPLGHVPLDAGNHNGVNIEVSGDVAAGSDLVVALYQDAGKQDGFDRQSDTPFWDDEIPSSNRATIE